MVIRKSVQFHFVKTIMDVLDIALLKTKVEKVVKIGQGMENR